MAQAKILKNQEHYYDSMKDFKWNSILECELDPTDKNCIWITGDELVKYGAKIELTEGKTRLFQWGLYELV